MFNVVKGLPDVPDKPIIWIVYSDDFIQHTRDYIARIRGQKYLDSFVTVVSRQNSSKFNGKIYFDPMIYDHLSNGQL